MSCHHSKGLLFSCRETVRAALDMLALTLTESGHIWTPEERVSYERAIRLIG